MRLETYYPYLLLLLQLGYLKYLKIDMKRNVMKIV